MLWSRKGETESQIDRIIPELIRAIQWFNQSEDYARYEDLVHSLSPEELIRLFEFSFRFPEPWDFDLEQRPLATYVAIGVALGLRPDESIPILEEALKVPEARPTLFSSLALASEGIYPLDPRVEPIIRGFFTGRHYFMTTPPEEIALFTLGLPPERRESFLQDFEESQVGQALTVREVIRQVRDELQRNQGAL